MTNLKFRQQEELSKLPQDASEHEIDRALERATKAHTPALKWVKARTVLHLHDDKGGTGISAPIPTGIGAQHPEEQNPRLQALLDLIEAAPETATQRDTLFTRNVKLTEMVEAFRSYLQDDSRSPRRRAVCLAGCEALLGSD